MCAIDSSAAISWLISYTVLLVVQLLQITQRHMISTVLSTKVGVSRKMTAAEWKLVQTDYQFNATPLWLALQKIYSWLQFPVLYLAARSTCEVRYLPRACLPSPGIFHGLCHTQLSLMKSGGVVDSRDGPQAFSAHLVSALLVLSQRQGIYIKKTSLPQVGWDKHYPIPWCTEQGIQNPRMDKSKACQPLH